MTAETERTLALRTMDRADLDRALEWAGAEGWNPGAYDTAAFHAADPAGHFVAEFGGEPVACVSAVRYGERFGFVGLYIVRPEYRGRGFGLTVWEAGMSHLTGRNVGLDGVLAQVPNYERSGFRVAHQTVRFAGTGGGARPADLVPLREVPFETVARYDATCFPGAREEFLREWVALPKSIALGATGAGGLTGFGVLRKAATGYKVGPLFADDAGTATRLLAGLAAAAPGEVYTIDVPDPSVQPAGGALVERFGLREVFRTARMYTAGAPVHDAARVFGVTSLELG